MPVLGGSPLGLINVKSTTVNGMSTFNDGKSRNINVVNYNQGRDVYPIKDLGVNANNEYSTPDINEGTRSIFSGPGVIAPFGAVGKTGTPKDNDPAFNKGSYKGINRSQLHNDQVYDISLLNIIEQLSLTQGSVRSADFAYLKDVGVFPNNRLMIARRYASPHMDNIFDSPGKETAGPLATLISWKPQNEDFLTISFGEEWVPAEADFKNVLNSLGNDFMGKSMGDRLGGAVAAVPLPGFTETLQRQVLQKLGVLEDNDKVPLPSGNPNLIKEAKRRKTIGYEQAGSGLRCSVSIKFVCEWEQKFISGIDPTIVFQDILSKITTFATSRSSTYGMTERAYNNMAAYLGKGGVQRLFSDVISAIAEGIKKVISNVKSLISGLASATSEKSSEADTLQQTLNTISGGTDSLSGKAFAILNRQIQKYRIEMLGIVRALSGLPSTPWHVTIGNPLRPTFCAGDMYMESDLTLTLGSTLAFNDLPSTIKAEFTLVNARPWGLQEILAKFNAGSIRVSKTIKDENDMNSGDPNPAIAGPAPSTGATVSTSGIKQSTRNTVTKTDNVTNKSNIGSVGAGPQTVNIPTAANGFVTNTTQTSLSAGNVPVTSVNTLTAAGTTKYTNNIVVGSAINPIATETDAVTNMIKNK